MECCKKVVGFFLLLLVFIVFMAGCWEKHSSEQETVVVEDSTRMNKFTQQKIEDYIGTLEDKNGRLDDSTLLPYFEDIKAFYKENDYAAVWSNNEKWEPLADTIFGFIKDAETYGLFPKEYHLDALNSLRKKIQADSVNRKNASLWSRADLLYTDAFMHITKDLKYGRLHPDSLTLNTDTLFTNDFCLRQMNRLLKEKKFSSLIVGLQPVHKGYWDLRNSIASFLDSMDHREYTYVVYPFKQKDSADSVKFIKQFQKRLQESGCISFTNTLPDTSELHAAVKKYQRLKGVRQDGLVSASLIRMLNNTDLEKFKRIAITLDRYKQLPAKMPKNYIWVNLPAFYLQVWDTDTLVFESKIICGKPATRTPLLTSYITDMVTYPTWTVPNSIIVKQYLPKLKNNPNYLSRLGLKLLNAKGEVISPAEVAWSRYSKGIPYKIMQGSGDNNALGVFKFNFNNPFAVYLHDTNERYLFKNASRAYSHGCVRVQDWEKLAFYITGNDSLNLKHGDTLRYNCDSIKNWIAAKQRRRIDVKTKLPLFIRYFSCEGRNGKVKFYEDIYGEDKAMREKYFKNF